MKAATYRWILFSIVTALTATVAQAKDSTAQGQEQQSQTQAGGQSASQREIRFSKLKDAKVSSSAGEELGGVEDLLINPSSGKIDFVVLGRGGILGLGEKLVPVPWQAIQVQSENQFTLNVDKNKLKSAPTLTRNYSELANPGYAITIYRFYEIPVGGAEGPGGSQQGGGQGAGNQNSSGSISGESQQQ